MPSKCSCQALFLTFFVRSLGRSPDADTTVLDPDFFNVVSLLATCLVPECIVLIELELHPTYGVGDLDWLAYATAIAPSD